MMVPDRRGGLRFSVVEWEPRLVRPSALLIVSLGVQSIEIWGSAQRFDLQS